MAQVSQVVDSQVAYDSDSTLKVLLVGDAEVGKTSIIRHICGEPFQSSYTNTIGIDFKTLFYTVRGEPIKVQVWDTAGQERFHTITKAYYRGSHGIVLVYDITSEESFANIDKWINSIREEGPQDVYLILFGNKVDLSNTWRCIDTSRGERLAQKFEMNFFEVSAKTGENVHEGFKAFVKGMKDHTAKVKDQASNDCEAVDGASPMRLTRERREGGDSKHSGCKCSS